jgi:hypothetical protein
MNLGYRSSILIAAMTAFTIPAHAQQPPDVVQSDSHDSTAMGTNALLSNEGAYGNTAAGFSAIYSNIRGSNNTAVGNFALYLNTGGSYNTASGDSALSSTTTGNYNTAFGAETLVNNTTGFDNTAIGTYALLYSTGNNNTAIGGSALVANTTGSNNTALGDQALSSNASGANNIGIGARGGDLLSGSDNIDIGNEGVANDSGIIRIGASGIQKHTFIAGISSSQVTGSAVYVTAAGKLGVLASSERYKTSIKSMGSDIAKLERLRPVTYHFKTDPHGAIQYGLIAEEVDKVYPELVIRDQSGRIAGIRYEELTPMLLKELQQQHEQLMEQQQRLAEIDQLKEQVAELRQANESMQASIAKVLVKEERVASR